MKIAGLVLVVLGIVTLIYGGFTYSHQKQLFDVGGLKATATEQKSIPISPIAGVLALVGGIALLVLPMKRA